MLEAYKSFWKNYFNFKGRASRGDYWWNILANMLIGFILGILISFVNQLSFLVILYQLLIIIPSISIFVRRLHDINKSGWLWLLSFIPIVGAIILLVFLCLPSVDENNQYND